MDCLLTARFRLAASKPVAASLVTSLRLSRANQVKAWSGPQHGCGA